MTKKAKSRKLLLDQVAAADRELTAAIVKLLIDKGKITAGEVLDSEWHEYLVECETEGEQPVDRSEWLEGFSDALD